uniref:CSON008730 protein n=1 Tax=Culicoides sonorensis TaxID=179676 RepID=A0A336LZS1_CULSO
MPQLNENVIHATQDGTACGRQGLEYELHMLMYLFINAFLHKLENFRMRFQIRDYDNEKKKPKEIGAFDDIVIRTENDEYILFQLKHKDITTKEPNKIQYSHLFPQNKSDFGIVKYIISYIKTKYCDTLKNYSDFTGKANKKNKIFKAVIYTNTIFNFDENNRISAQNPDEYIIADEFSINDLNHKVLTSFLSKGGKSYHKFSFNEIIRNIKDGKEISKLRKVIADCYKVEESEISEKQIEEEIEDASDHIIYAGNQPNYKTLRELTEKMIEQHFIIFDVNNFVQSLYKDLINWTSHKETFPPEITFENICNYFKPHFKFYYCLPDPITPFCENTEELFVLNVAAKVLIKCHDFLPLDSNSDNSINYMKCAMQEKLNLQSYNRVTNWISNKLWKHENDEHLIVELDSMLNNLRKLGKSNACKVIPEILMKSYNRLKLPNNSSFLKSFIMTNIINNDWTVTLPKIIVSGDCGLGKSELILRLIDILKRENYFDIIIRISAESENSVMNSLQQVALKLNRKSNCSGDTIENTIIGKA